MNLGHIPLPGAVDGQFGQEEDESKTGRALDGKGRDKRGWGGAYRVSARAFGGARRGDAGCAPVCWALHSGRGDPCAGEPLIFPMDGCLALNPQEQWKQVSVSGGRRSLLWGGDVIVERWCGTRWWIKLLVWPRMG